MDQFPTASVNHRVSLVLGTRPEAVKLAPVILALQAAGNFSTRVIQTGQHQHLVKPVMDLFGLAPDRDLALMTPRQSLAHITCTALTGLQEDFLRHPPHLVLVQGDTTTAFAAALAAFYERVPLAHVEAGLRTDDLWNGAYLPKCQTLKTLHHYGLMGLKLVSIFHDEIANNFQYLHL